MGLCKYRRPVGALTDCRELGRLLYVKGRTYSRKAFNPGESLGSLAMKRILLTASLTLVLFFAGCTSEPSARPVDFSGVDAKEGVGGFTLTVKVVGVGNETKPLAGAFVGAARDFNAIAKATTNADGEAVLQVRKDQTIRVVAQAPGWTTEDSGEIRIGDGGEERSDCGSFSITVNSQSQSSSWCVVTDSNSTTSYRLDGKEGRVSIVLLEKIVERRLSVPVGPHANGFVAVLPDGKEWASQAVPINPDPDLQRLYMNRLIETQTTLSWRNSMLEQGDFELGVGCARETPAVRTSNNVPYLTQQTGPVSVTKDWAPKSMGTWSTCSSFFVGPIVDTVNSQVTTSVLAKLVFKGQSRIIPVGT